LKKGEKDNEAAFSTAERGGKKDREEQIVSVSARKEGLARSAERDSARLKLSRKAGKNE